MSAERDLEQLRQSFAVERSALENDLAKARRAYALLAERYSEMGREFESTKDEIAKLRRLLDEACSGEKELDGPVHVALPPVERFARRLGDYCPSPVEPSAPRQPILRCSQCDSQVGPSHWSRDGERRCEKCGPFEPRSEKPKRDLSTEESREFWRKAEEAAKEIQTWPDWKRAGINAVQIRSEPRVATDGRCEACGTTKVAADDECYWCGPGAHRP